MRLFNLKSNTAKTVKEPKKWVVADPPAGSGGFRRAYNMLRLADIREVEDEIKEELGWRSMSTFRSRQYGNSTIRPDEQLKLNKIFGKRGIDAVTGELIEPINNEILN